MCWLAGSTRCEEMCIVCKNLKALWLRLCVCVWVLWSDTSLMSNIDDCVEMKLAADTQTQAPGATIKLKHWLCVCIYMHTHTHMHTCTRGGFGVQRMFYFGNSFGLVTLHWWQTEKQVANIKHFTSTATCSNTHANTQTHIHTQTHILALLVFPSFLSLLIPRNISPKGGCVVLNLLACFSFTSS